MGTIEEATLARVKRRFAGKEAAVERAFATRESFLAGHPVATLISILRTARAYSTVCVPYYVAVLAATVATVMFPVSPPWRAEPNTVDQSAAVLACATIVAVSARPSTPDL